MFKKYWKFFVIFWSVVLVGIIGVFVFFWLISAGKLGFMPTFEELENPNNRFASEVYFADGPIMNRYFEKENRKYIEYREIPQSVIDALIATEDVRFYDHSGVDVRGLFRVAKGLLTANTSAGGGSTISQQLAKMLFANPHRMDYYDRYQEIIDAYNAEQNRATIEKTFMDLMELANSLDTEQQRYVREGFSSDEELSVYDLLFSENLTKQEIETIKKVSVDLLTKIKQQIAKLDHWTDKQETKAIVDNLIRNTLWQELPNSYDVSDIQTYQKKIYEYVYMRYPEVA